MNGVQRILIVAVASASSLLAVERACAEGDAKPAPTVSYFRDIRPIFQVHCHGCHQPAKPMGEFVMTNFKALFAGGESAQAAVVPGEPDKSYLLTQITPASGKAEMPKDKEPLTEDQIKRIRQWIAEGANDDTPQSVRASDRRRTPASLRGIASSDGDRFFAGRHAVGRFRLSRNLALESGWLGARRTTGGAIRADRVGGVLARWQAIGRHGRFTGEIGRGASLGCGQSQTESHRERDVRHGVWRSWSGDGSKIAFGCGDNTLRAIEAATGKQVLYQGAHSDWVLDTVFSKEAELRHFGQSRSLDEAGGGRHAAVRRQHHEHHARRAQRRAGGGRSSSGQGRTADRRRRWHPEDLSNAADQGTGDRRRLQLDQSV